MSKPTMNYLIKPSPIKLVFSQGFSLEPSSLFTRVICVALIMIMATFSVPTNATETRDFDIQIEPWRDNLPAIAPNGTYPMIAHLPQDGENDIDVKTVISGIIQLDERTDLEKSNERALPLNIGKTIRYTQSLNNVPIWDSAIVVEENVLGVMQSISGRATYNIAENVGLVVSPKYSPEKALEKARSEFNIGNKIDVNRTFPLENVQSDLIYFPAGEDGDLTLTYHVSFYTHKVDEKGNVIPTRPVYFIDANSTDVLEFYDNIQNVNVAGGSGGNLKTGRYIYGENGLSKFQVKKEGNVCAMDSEQVLTENLNHQTFGSGKAHEFSCDTNNVKEINGAYSPLNDAHTFGKVVFDMFDEWYGSSPLQSKLHLRVHFGLNYENATWNGRQMSFGDGEDKFYPLVSLDVTAHEVSHGFTEQNSGLHYRGQSGGMNEAFSDMAGEAAEYYFSEKTPDAFHRSMPDYKTGSDIFKAEGGALRYMCDPSQDGKSIDHIDSFYSGMDVHHSSGVYNKVFCVLSKKPRWNIKKAFDVFYVANKAYWIQDENFNTGAEKVLKATRRIGYKAADVIDAFSEVGIQL